MERDLPKSARPLLGQRDRLEGRECRRATCTPTDRRREGRARGVTVFANKYIEGVPHMVQLLDLSSDGLRVRRLLEPESRADTFPIELFVGGFTTWAWTRRIWRRGDREALQIVSADAIDRARIRKFLRSVVAA